MRELIKAILYFCALLMAGCASYNPPAPGHTYTDPIASRVSSAAGNLNSAIPTLDLAVAKGAQAGDVNLAKADKSVHAAQQQLKDVPAFVVKVNKVIDDAAKSINALNIKNAKMAHELLIYHCIEAGLALAVVGWGFLTFGLPLLKLIPL